MTETIPPAPERSVPGPLPVRRLPLTGDDLAPVAAEEAPSFVAAPRHAKSSAVALDRMQVEELSISYADKLAVARRGPRSATADPAPPVLVS